MLDIQLVDIQNVVIAGVILFAAYRVYQKYQLTKARALLWLCFGTLYYMVFRVVSIFMVFDNVTRNWLILPFVLSFAFGMDRMLKLIRMYIRERNKGNWFTRLFKKG